MKVTTATLLNQCYGRYAVPAVNVFFMEEVISLFRAAQRWAAPIIVQTTPFARDYAGADMLVSMVEAAERTYPDVVFALHLDHGVESHIDEAINSGRYTSVMIDASHDNFDRNVERTAAVVRMAREKGISVEAELGVLAGVEDDLLVSAEKSFYTSPVQALDFVGSTGCDSLAIAVGTSHGAYKFSGGQGLRFDILAEIQEKLPGFPLVLHGGSNVQAGVIKRINDAGGKLGDAARGVRDEEVRRAIPLGITKVNIATDMRLLWTMVNREFFRDRPGEFTPTTAGALYMEAYTDYIGTKIALLGADGKAAEFS